jgi:hypothetical protein
MTRLALIAVLTLGFALSAPAATVVDLVGTDLNGGAAEVFGSTYGGEIEVNYIYAQPTGVRSSMAASFGMAEGPKGPLFLYVKGRDDDGPGKCRIAIELNGQALFSGANEFSETEWLVKRYVIPDGALKARRNELRFACLETEGRLGMPPWFQLARCAIAGDGYVIGHDITETFHVVLPGELREFPERLPAGGKPGFAWRGTKGWMWKPEQYLAEVPVLAKYRGNFLMNCYTSMCDVEHYAWGNPEVNRWWEDLPAAKKAAYERIVRECDKRGVAFCFSMNPNLCSKRPLLYSSDADIDALWKHYAWMQGMGVKWFNISLDDISQGIDASGQARVVNEICRRLKARDSDARMIFTPTRYWGDGTDADSRPYLQTLARELDKDVYLFWTGDSVVGNITRKAAQSYRDISKHRLFLWDNYPVNDAQPTMHLGPLINRDPDLCEVIDGYMSNAMCAQNEGNRIPLLTCLDYAYNPAAYDPMRSIGQAIAHLQSAPESRRALADLVEAYPGFVIYGVPRTGLNPVRERFARIVAVPQSHFVVQAYIRSLEDLSARIAKAFPKSFAAERKTLDDDIAYARKMAKERYGE